ncbi:hypothetical protein [Undibacterium sp. TS12]|uniref:hypothetical protein n=1 Tax=Undibacterium sp. TS12 TaxID=2908202 RepID=UPI001F4C9E6E|nr:hypothetical protein [Undibacterium sp. TS12]MCH8619241.1 hypothetical protein [Undibacterium sp. TS12]
MPAICQRLLLGILLMYGTVACAASAGNKIDEPVSLHLNQLFQVAVPGACALVPKDQLNLVELRINGILSQLKPVDCDHDPAMNKLSFFLPQQDNSKNEIQRESLMGSPWRELKNGFRRDLPFSISFNNGAGNTVLATGSFRYQILQPAYILIGFGFIIAVAYALLRLGRDSGLLRDAAGTVAVQQRTYSLARVQMAWWFFIVFASYVWLWIVGEGIPDISTQALGLMGIGSGTYMAAASVDASKNCQYGESQGFFDDIISDGQGLALYRFQMLVFNVLFGVLFLVYVIQHVAMPDFDGSILTLLGMSSGTYAGFKIPEQQGKPQQTEDPKAAYSAEA